MDQKQTIINIGLALIIAMVSAIGNVMWNSISDLRRVDADLISQIVAVKLQMSDSYVKRSDLERMTAEIFIKLDKIETKIDKKADKP